MPKTAYKSVSINKKLEILEEAKVAKNDQAIARKYGIAPVTLRGWRKQENKLREAKADNKGKLKRTGKTEAFHYYPKMEIVLAAWIREMWELG